MDVDDNRFRIYFRTLTPSTVACKKVQTSEYGTNQEEFETEIAYIKAMNHPNILTVIWRSAFYNLIY